jgi:hypothetical protein
MNLGEQPSDRVKKKKKKKKKKLEVPYQPVVYLT